MATLLIFHQQSHILQNSGSSVKKVNDEIYFWHADKHRSLLRVDTITLGVCNQACPKYPKYEVCIFLRYFQKWMGKAGSEVDFLPANKHESFLKLIVSLWICIARDAQSTQTYKFTISL